MALELNRRRATKSRWFAQALLIFTASCVASPPRVSIPESPAVTLAAGIHALRKGEAERGIALCEAALAAAGEDRAVTAEAHSWLAHGYTLVLDPESALRHCTAAIEQRPSDPWLRYAQGVALQSLGRKEEARYAFDEAIALDPQHIKAFQWRANIFASEGRYAKAIADLDRALEILEVTEEAPIANWGGARDELLMATLRARADCRDLIGEHEFAERDRQRARKLSEASGERLGPAQSKP